MTFSLKPEGRTLRVLLSESIDLASTAALKEEFESLMSTEIAEVNVNAGNLDYIDSSGVASFLFMRKLCARFGANLVISAISAPAARVIQLANLTDVLGLPRTAHESLQNIKNSLAKEVVFSEEEALSLFKHQTS